MGRWMKVNSESIYASEASPFARLPFFGRATTKGNTVYLHVFQWPSGGVLRVPGLKNTVRSVRVLGAANAKPAPRRDGPDVLIAGLPQDPPDDAASVIAIELDGRPQVERYVIRPNAKGVFHLGAESSEIETRFEQRAKKENLLGHVYITRWVRADDVPTWTINVPHAGQYHVSVTYGAGGNSEGTPFTISVGDAKVEGKVQRTARDLAFKNFSVGAVPLKAGEMTVQIRPQMRQGVAAMNLESIRISPVEE
jgi:alpha-L-fucosidase